MRSLAVLFAASSLAWPLATLAGTPKPHPAQHEDQLRKQMQHQQQMEQQQIRQQQALMNKMMHQQQEAMKQQMKAAQAEQQRQQKQVAASHQAAKPKPVSPTSTIAAPAGINHVGSAHHATGYRVYHHRNNQVYRHHTRWPVQVDPETAALRGLKSALDGVARSQTSNDHHAGTLTRALERVVEVDHPPTELAVRDLANHLANGLARRESAQVDTATMALALRGVMNSTILSRTDLQTVLHEHKTALRAARVPAADASAIETALRTITSQEQARR